MRSDYHVALCPSHGDVRRQQAMTRKPTTTLLASALALLSSSPAEAESPYELSPAYDIPVYLLAGAATMIAFVEQPAPSCLPDACNAADINPFDRNAVRVYSPTLRTASDVMVLSLVGLPVVLDLIDSGGDGWLEDMVVYGQALLVAQGLTQIAKKSVRRPAPFVYNPRVPMDVRSDSPDAPGSFWSGHASTAFSAAAAYTTTYWLRHPGSEWRWLVLATSAAAATGVGLIKIHAGYHYPTDIIAGAGAGIASGMLVPLLHLP
jgi:membrane-associated phospholipid phosphatase